MKRNRAVLMAAVLAITAITAPAAWADRGWSRHGHHPGHYDRYRGYDGRAVGLGAGLVLGSALLWAVTRPAPVVAAPPPVVVAAPPPVYVAPPVAPVVAVPPAPEWWYYCRPLGAYYPYVGSCPAPWEPVPAR